MDVILLNGGIWTWEKSIFSRSIGPYKIAHWLRKSDYQVQVIDHVTQITEEQLYAAVKKFITPKTLVIGISTTFLYGSAAQTNHVIHHCPDHVFKVLKAIKEEYNIKVVVGGYGSDHLPNYDIIDVTTMSYTTACEDIFLEYVDHLKYGHPEPIGSVQEMMDSSKRIVYDRARNPVYNIETDDFRFIKQDVILPTETLPFDISKGCIFSCKFCQFIHLGKAKMDYIRSMTCVEDELRYNYEMFGTTNYYILDDTFNDTEWKLNEFYKTTQRLPFKITYSAYLRADLIHRFPDMAFMLKESGLFGAFHGIESLHPSASKIIGKGWSGKHARDYIPKLFHDIWKGEIAQNNAFIVGLPDDTKENLFDTIKWHEENKLHCLTLSSLRLTTGESMVTVQSEFDKNATQYGFTFDEQGWINNNWTNTTAKQFYKEISKLTDNSNKITMWLAGTLLTYGYTREFILNTLNKNLPWKDIQAKTNSMYQTYYKTLMELY